MTQGFVLEPMSRNVDPEFEAPKIFRLESAGIKKDCFQLEIIINVLVSSSRYI